MAVHLLGNRQGQHGHGHDQLILAPQQPAPAVQQPVQQFDDPAPPVPSSSWNATSDELAAHDEFDRYVAGVNAGYSGFYKVDY